LGDSWIWWSLLAVEWAVRLGVGLRVLLRRCPGADTLTWLLVLVLVPVFGLVLFLLVGDNQLGRRRAKRYARLAKGTHDRAVALWRHQCKEWVPSDEPYRRLAAIGESLSASPPLTGNRLELIDDAAKFLERLIVDIDSSREHCHLLFYIWMRTGRGVAVAEALIRAAKRGVACRVLVDAVGGKQFWKSDLPAMMARGGVDVVDALPANPLRVALARVDLRNHRKIVVIDGRLGYCGSHNLTDETFPLRGRARKFARWLDSTVRIEGPAVQALQTTFLCDWLLDRDEVLPPLESFFPDCAPAGDSIAHVISSGPLPGLNAIHQTKLAMLFTAQREIMMSTPYFVPDEATKAALVNAAVRGVAVTLIFPDRLDVPIVDAASRAHYGDLLEAGIRIFNHRGGLLHSKTATIDGRLAVVGSANFDMRSFGLNFETSVFVYDAGFAASLRELQSKYIADSAEVTLDDWRCRAWARRLVDHAAQLLAPLL
jgi:cardiolipin synthase